MTKSPSEPVETVCEGAEFLRATEPLVGCPLTRGWRLALAGWGLFLVGGFLFAATIEPDPRGYGTHQRLGLPPCSLRLIFDVPCPSCGGTTCFTLFVRGRWAEALAANAAAFGLALFSAVLIPWSLCSAALGRTWRVNRPDLLISWCLGLFCVTSILQWLTVIAWSHWVSK